MLYRRRSRAGTLAQRGQVERDDGECTANGAAGIRLLLNRLIALCANVSRAY